MANIHEIGVVWQDGRQFDYWLSAVLWFFRYLDWVFGSHHQYEYKWVVHHSNDESPQQQ